MKCPQKTLKNLGQIKNLGFSAILLALALQSEARAGVGVDTSSASSDNTWSSKPSWALGNEPTLPSGSNRRKKKISQYQTITPAPFAPESNNLALAVGQVFLMGNLGNKFADSMGSELQYTYGVSDMFAFNSNLGYSNHSDGKYSMTTLTTGVRANLSWFDRVIPYFAVGLGFYKPSVTFSDDSSVSAVVFGLHMGPGVDLQVTKQLFFGAGLTFHDMFSTTATTAQNVPVDIGGTYTSFLVHAGASF